MLTVKNLTYTIDYSNKSNGTNMSSLVQFLLGKIL